MAWIPLIPLYRSMSKMDDLIEGDQGTSFLIGGLIGIVAAAGITFGAIGAWDKFREYFPSRETVEFQERIYDNIPQPDRSIVIGADRNGNGSLSSGELGKLLRKHSLVPRVGRSGEAS